MIPHIMRYAWATQYAWGKTVTDLGCGTGYGSYLLSMVARNVIGVDIDMSAIHYAIQHFQADNLSFIAQDISGSHVPIGQLYTAFEVLEHVDDPGLLVQGLAAPLAWSIPVGVDNRWHKQVYSIDDIVSLMGGATHYQDAEGTIVPREMAWFEPAYVLGVTQ
jgi:SAM-dependent methyltransferase